MFLKLLSSFIGSMLAFVLSVYVFAPDRIPAGWGYQATPVEVNINSNLGSELIGSLTGKSTKNVRIKNTHNTTLHNLNVTLYDENKNLKKHYMQANLPINSVLTLGWAEQWDIKPGDQVSVSAALFKEVLWAL